MLLLLLFFSFARVAAASCVLILSNPATDTIMNTTNQREGNNVTNKRQGYHARDTDRKSWAVEQRPSGESPFFWLLLFVQPTILQFGRQEGANTPF